MEMIAIAVAVAIVVGTVSKMNLRQKTFTESARLLEEALKNPSVDQETVESLTYQMTGRKPLRMTSSKSHGMAWVLAVGWIGLFVGLGLLIAGNLVYDRELETAGWIVGLIALGFLTYPFALNELRTRKAA